MYSYLVYQTLNIIFCVLLPPTCIKAADHLGGVPPYNNIPVLCGAHYNIRSLTHSPICANYVLVSSVGVGLVVVDH
jgi:hypothetical protein